MNVQEKAMQEFKRCEEDLLRALNGYGRPAGSQNEIEELRRNLFRAKNACEQLGVEAETLWERVQKSRKEREEDVRAFAHEQLKATPLLSHDVRNRIAQTVGVIVLALILFTWPSVGGLFGALLGGFVAFVAVDGILMELLPTPPVRIARMACDLDTDVSDIWPSGSDELKDYRAAYSMHAYRLENRGRPGGFIRAR